MWNTGGCRSWYMDEHGVNRALWSGMTWEYWLATRKFKLSEYSSPDVPRRDTPNTRCCVSAGCRTPGVVSVAAIEFCRQSKIAVKWGPSERR